MREAKSACGSTGGLVCGIEAPLKKMGNIQAATLTIQSEIIGKENKFNSSGVKACSRIQVQNVVLSVSLLCSKKKNMDVALQSKDFDPDPTEGFVQEYTLCDTSALEKDSFYIFEKSGVDLETVTIQVLDIDNVLIQTLNENSDYLLSAHGFELLQDLVIPGAVYLRVTYDFDDSSIDEFNFLSEFKGARYIYFKGTNYGEGEDEPLGVEIYKVLFNPVSQLDLISQGTYFLLNLTGQVEVDFENQDLGLGGYFKIRRG